jgi:hypothetical protein
MLVIHYKSSIFNCACVWAVPEQYRPKETHNYPGEQSGFSFLTKFLSVHQVKLLPLF